MVDPFNRDSTAVYDQIEEVAVPGPIRVRRLTCDNPSPMTFTGTQTYIVGSGEVVVIDPGPAREGHLERLLAGLTPGERISHIAVTHSHVDHSPGSRWLAARTGAPILAFGPHGAGMTEIMQRLPDLGGGEGGDRAFAPDALITPGEMICGRDWQLTGLHTPGHLSNHLSLALGDTGAVFTGDTVMGWATTLVSPPEGDMAAFMGSLAYLKAREDILYLPGHGHPVEDPTRMLSHQISHRNTRAEQVLLALEDGPADPASLTARIYTDIDPRLLPAAARNVLSTLIWKMSEGEAATNGPITSSSVFRRV